MFTPRLKLDKTAFIISSSANLKDTLTARNSDAFKWDQTLWFTPTLNTHFISIERTFFFWRVYIPQRDDEYPQPFHMGFPPPPPPPPPPKPDCPFSLSLDQFWIAKRAHSLCLTGFQCFVLVVGQHCKVGKWGGRDGTRVCQQWVITRHQNADFACRLFFTHINICRCNNEKQSSNESVNQSINLYLYSFLLKKKITISMKILKVIIWVLAAWNNHRG